MSNKQHNSFNFHFRRRIISRWQYNTGSVPSVSCYFPQSVNSLSFIYIFLFLNSVSIDSSCVIHGRSRQISSKFRNNKAASKRLLIHFHISLYPSALLRVITRNYLVVRLCPANRKRYGRCAARQTGSCLCMTLADCHQYLKRC